MVQKLEFNWSSSRGQVSRNTGREHGATEEFKRTVKVGSSGTEAEASSAASSACTPARRAADTAAVRGLIFMIPKLDGNRGFATSSAIRNRERLLG